jgi:hypothetical protein
VQKGSKLKDGKKSNSKFKSKNKIGYSGARFTLSNSINPLSAHKSTNQPICSQQAGAIPPKVRQRRGPGDPLQGGHANTPTSAHCYSLLIKLELPMTALPKSTLATIPHPCLQINKSTNPPNTAYRYCHCYYSLSLACYVIMNYIVFP